MAKFYDPSGNEISKRDYEEAIDSGANPADFKVVITEVSDFDYNYFDMYDDGDFEEVTFDGGADYGE